jgi:hypothetical protein
VFYLAETLTLTRAINDSIITQGLMAVKSATDLFFNCIIAYDSTTVLINFPLTLCLLSSFAFTSILILQNVGVGVDPGEQ